MTALPGFIDVPVLQRELRGRDEVGLIDVREAGEFANGHLFFASSAPLSVFEDRLLHLAPRRSARIVLVDDGSSGRARRAGALAVAMGYSNIHILQGGCAAWKAAGHELFEGVYVPSKTFGELVEHAFQVPHLSPRELDGWLKAAIPVVIFDGRPFDEHQKMNIPGSICMPNGELVYRAATLVPDDTTPVVVHCAGRTRSIIGAQILRESGLPNPIFALENGTQGWTLSGLILEHGSTRTAESTAPVLTRTELVEMARCRAAEWQVPYVSPGTCSEWLHDNGRTTYFLDVRTAPEYAAAHPDGARHAPGGQLLQSTDTWLAVRGARVVLVDHAELRAVTAARWLRLMGWDAHVLHGGIESWPLVTPPPPPPSLVLAELHRRTPDPANLPSMIIDMRSSSHYRAGHIAGARWTLRPDLTRAVRGVSKSERIGICGHNGIALGRIVDDLRQMGFENLEWYGGELKKWASAGCPTVATPDVPSDSDAIDFVLFTHDRHSGNLDAARRYLAWETGLVNRLSETERNSFNLCSNKEKMP